MTTLCLARRSLLAIVAALGLLAASACSGGYDIPLPAGYQPPQGDVDCDTDNEPSQGDVCTRDCVGKATCASGMGDRVCTCEGGVFLQCVCLPPPEWPYDDVPVAPYCDKISGRPRYLAGERCSGDISCRSTTHPDQACRCVMNTWQCNQPDVPAEAPACEDFGSGIMATLDKRSCRKADEGFDTWALCVARNYNPDGTSPRGCICLADGNWKCSATNRWYRAE